MAETGAKAQALILAGKVRAPGLKNVKPGEKVRLDQEIELVADLPYVSRGGEKLAAALDEFGVTVAGRFCLDVGASTGGFTDCLLQRGAVGVLAVDVGHGQLHWKLRNDPRVENLEKTHARDLTADRVAASAGPALWPGLLTVVDVSFISLDKVLPAVAGATPPGGEFVALLKPQFEVGPKDVPGGIVRDDAVREAVLSRVQSQADGWGFRFEKSMVSPLKGRDGNVEYLLHLRKKT